MEMKKCVSRAHSTVLNTAETVTNRASSRYHRIGHDTKAIEKQFVEFFLESYPKPPRAIVWTWM